MHVVKQLVGELAKPLVVALLLCAMAAVYRCRGWRRSAVWLLTSAAAVVCLGCLYPVGDALLGSLERRYPPLREDRPLPAVAYIVVLGTGYTPRDGIPVTAALDEEGLVRIVEGVRLARRLGAVRLVVSGGAEPGHVASAFGYAVLARDLGVDRASLIVLATAVDTRNEALTVAALLGSAPFILVTSASHMPRAMRLMTRAGAHPIPAPTGQRAGKAMGMRSLLPTSDALRATELALHEYLGLAAIAAGLD